MYEEAVVATLTFVIVAVLFLKLAIRCRRHKTKEIVAETAAAAAATPKHVWWDPQDDVERVTVENVVWTTAWLELWRHKHQRFMDIEVELQLKDFSSTPLTTKKTLVRTTVGRLTRIYSYMFMSAVGKCNVDLVTWRIMLERRIHEDGISKPQIQILLQDEQDAKSSAEIEYLGLANRENSMTYDDWRRCAQESFEYEKEFKTNHPFQSRLKLSSPSSCLVTCAEGQMYTGHEDSRTPMVGKRDSEQNGTVTIDLAQLVRRLETCAGPDLVRWVNNHDRVALVGPSVLAAFDSASRLVLADDSPSSVIQRSLVVGHHYSNDQHEESSKQDHIWRCADTVCAVFYDKQHPWRAILDEFKKISSSRYWSSSELGVETWTSQFPIRPIRWVLIDVENVASKWPLLWMASCQVDIHAVVWFKKQLVLCQRSAHALCFSCNPWRPDLSLQYQLLWRRGYSVSNAPDSIRALYDTKSSTTIVARHTLDGESGRQGFWPLENLWPYGPEYASWTEQTYRDAFRKQ